MPLPISVEQLGPELSRIRKERGLSLRDVAGEIKISASTLSRIERGSRPDLDVVERVARYLGVSIASGAQPSRTAQSDDDVVRVVEVHLRANKRLSVQAAQSIAETVRLILANTGRAGPSGTR